MQFFKINFRKSLNIILPERGITLVELVITLIIVGILATAAMMRYIDLSHAANAAACKTNQSSLETAQTMYFIEKMQEGNGHYATSLQELKPYLKEEIIPQCPSGGNYELLDNGKVRCSISSHN